MKIPNFFLLSSLSAVSLARIVSEDSQLPFVEDETGYKSSKDS